MLAAIGVLALLAGRRRATWLALVWVGTSLTVILLVMQPTDPRKVLPSIPPMLLLLIAAAGGRHFRAVPRLALVAAVVFTIVFAAKAVPLVRTLDSEATPEHQAVAYIAQHFGPDDAVILAGTSLNHLYYELPQYASLPVDFIDENDLAQELASKPYRYIISLDQWEPSIDLPPQFVKQDVFSFERDNRVLPKGSVVPFTLYERPLP
jgi:hypothetical protein